MALSLETIGVCKKYTDGSIEGIVGSLSGKPCQIQSITPITGGNRVTYLWEDNSGDSHTSTMDVMDGVDGEVPAETLLKDTVGWTGKNVFNLIATSKTDEYGLTWTVNANNTITVSGTPTDFKAYYIRHDGTLPAGQYIFSGWGNATNITVNSGFLRKGNTEVRKILNGNLSDPQTIEILDSDAGTYDNILISLKRIENNVACSGTVYPMLRKAEISDPTFEPYHKNVDLVKYNRAEANVLGAKNLFLNTAVTTTTEQGVTYTVNSDKTVTIASGQTTSTYTNLSLGSIVLPEGNYILNGCPSGGSANTYRLRLVNGSTLLGIDSGDGYSFYADGNTNYTVTIGLSANGVSYTIPTDLLFKPMIRLASDPDDTYVPYAETNYQLTQNKMSYKDNGILGAKNLLPYPFMDATKTINDITFTDNGDGTITVNGTASADAQYNFTNPITNNPYTSMILSGDPSGDTTGTYYFLRDRVSNAGAFVSEFADKGSGVIITSVNATYGHQIQFVVKNGATVSNLIVKPMLRLVSDSDNTYQPYAKTNKELTEDVKRVPTAPTTDGTYSLKVTVASGTPTYSWVSD